MIFSRPAAVLVSVVAIMASAHGQSPQTIETVKVGTQAKNAFGTITAMQNGDIACYLTLKDDSGKVFKEMADFAICQQQATLLNKRVALAYKLERTQSPECQGDPDCKKSVTVALVVAAKPAQAAVAAAARTSLCTASEDIIFACRGEAKLVSVCASKGATAKSGSLVYRFGDAAPDKPVTLTLPRDKTVPSKAATGAFDPFAGGGGAWLRFTQGEYANTVYSGIGKWGPNGETREKAGLLVERNGKQIALMKCSGKYRSELGPDLIERLDIQMGDQTFDYPDL